MGQSLLLSVSYLVCPFSLFQPLGRQTLISLSCFLKSVTVFQLPLSSKANKAGQLCFALAKVVVVDDDEPLSVLLILLFLLISLPSSSPLFPSSLTPSLLPVSFHLQ